MALSTRSLKYIISGEDRLSPVLKKASDNAVTHSNRISGAFKHAGVAMATAFAAVAVVAGTALVTTVDMATKAQKATDLLTVAAKNSGIAWRGYSGHVNTVVASMAKLGYGQAEAQTAMSRMITAAGREGGSLRAMGAAADFAKYKHIDLADSAQALAQAAAGNSRALRTLGISSKDLGKHFSTTGTDATRLHKVIGLLENRIGGEASKASKSFSGKMEALKATLGNVAVKIGDKLLPALTFLAGWIADTGIPKIAAFWDAFKNTAAFKSFVQWITTVVGVLKTGVTGYGMPAWEKFLNEIHIILTQKLVPILKIFWQTGVKLFDALKPGFKDLWGAVKQLAPALVTLWKAWAPIIGPVIKLALVAIVVAFRLIAWAINHVVAPVLVFLANLTATVVKGIIRGFVNVKDNLVGAWHKVASAWNAAWDFFSGLITNIKKVFKLGWDYIQLAALTCVAKVLGAFSSIPIIGKYFKSAEGQVNKWINAIQADINGLNGRNIKIGVAFASVQSGKGQGPVWAKPAARGGHIKGPGTGTSDSILAMLSNGEYVVKASAVRKYGTGMLRDINMGKYASGGPVNISERTTLTPDATTIAAMMSRAVLKMASGITGSIGASAAAIINYGASFLGRVPYVWGGDTPAGWDCSGFLSFLYRAAHLMNGRLTAQGFRDWGQPTGSPVPGGYVTFGNPAYHIALAAGGNRTLEAGGGMTPTWGTIAGASSYGVPVGRFDTGGVLRPGYTLAYNGTGSDEYLHRGNGNNIIVNINPRMMVSDKKSLMRELVDGLQEWSDKGGRLPEHRGPGRR